MALHKLKAHLRWSPFGPGRWIKIRIRDQTGNEFVCAYEKNMEFVVYSGDEAMVQCVAATKQGGVLRGYSKEFKIISNGDELGVISRGRVFDYLFFGGKTYRLPECFAPRIKPLGLSFSWFRLALGGDQTVTVSNPEYFRIALALLCYLCMRNIYIRG